MSTLDGKTILITGANGFLGRHLITRLAKSDSRLHAISRSISAADGNIRWWQGDLLDAEWLNHVIGSVKPDVIYQLASASQGGQDLQFVMPSFENDLRTTVNTLLAAKEHGCSRVVLVASLEEPVYDGRPISLSSPYAAAKAAATFYGLMFHQLYEVPVTILRPYMTYGPGQKEHKLVPYTILSLLKGQAPKSSSGTRPVDWVYVEDVIQAFITAADEPQAIGTVIDLGSGMLVPVRQVVEQIHELIPGSPAPQIGALPDRKNETIRCADTQTAFRILGWKATTPLSEGLAKTIDWYRASLGKPTADAPTPT